jgi:predicted MFS family arabinose efflux permease
MARGAPFLVTFGVASLGIGLARGVTTTYVPVLLDDSGASPGMIGVLMMVNPVAGFTVPLVIGYLGDRSPRPRPWRAFLGAGAIVASAALVSVAILSAGSVPLLAVSALGVYVGVAAAAMAHRSMILARFSEEERPAATSSQEGQKTAGGLLGLLAGGALIEVAPPLPFLLAAAVLPVLAVPTIAVMRRRKGHQRRADAPSRRPPHAKAGVKTLLHVLRLPGARLVLLAQILWVTAYVALPTFFIVAMHEEFDAAPFESALGIAALGVLSGGALLAAGRTPPRHVSGLLLLGAVLLGTGLPVAALIRDFGWALVPLGAAGIGFGLLTALGFAYFSRFVPEEESGSSSGAYFAGRALAATMALPLAGLLITVTGSYRAILVQGIIALGAVVPIALARRQDARREGRRRKAETGCARAPAQASSAAPN